MDTQSTGFVVWFTGMKRAGKSTLAKLVAGRLAASGRPVELLDEDGEARALLEGLDWKRVHTKETPAPALPGPVMRFMALPPASKVSKRLAAGHRAACPGGPAGGRVG